MKILIIGSKGFIGSHLVRYFDKQNEVWQCDVVTDYTTPRYMQIDASNSDFNSVFEEHSYDVCVNCSGAASVPDSLKHPYRDFLLNTANVYAILNAIHTNCPACKFINLSSAAVYGNPHRCRHMAGIKQWLRLYVASSRKSLAFRLVRCVSSLLLATDCASRYSGT